MKTLLMVGLGNPGKKYEKTRHNTGFMFMDYFWFENRKNFSDWEFSKKTNADVSIGNLENNRIILLKPRTFMNLSGEAVKKTLKIYNLNFSETQLWENQGQTLDLGNLIVAHDEIDLPLGSYRISRNRSSAGHKGVQNIIDTLDTKNFTRVRIGIDNRGKKKIETEKYVLGKFTITETKILKNVLEKSLRELLKNIFF